MARRYPHRAQTSVEAIGAAVDHALGRQRNRIQMISGKVTCALLPPTVRAGPRCAVTLGLQQQLARLGII